MNGMKEWIEWNRMKPRSESSEASDRIEWNRIEYSYLRDPIEWDIWIGIESNEWDGIE